MHRIKTTVLLTLALLAATLSTQAATAAATIPAAEQHTDTSFCATLTQRLDRLLQNDIFQRTQLGLYVYDLTDDKPLYQHGARQCLRPASCQKVITAVAALDLLGTDYKYATTLFITAEPKDSVLHGNLAIKAGFDPMFDHDDMYAFVQALKDRGIYRIEGDVLIDVSMKDTTTMGWGWCWDDDEPPLTPLLYRSRDRFAANMQQMMAENGIRFCGNFRKARVPAGATAISTRTRTIDQILISMMKDSDNLYAESLFYQIAARSGRAYASHKQAAALVKDFIKRLSLTPSHYQIADGSGLSLYNYITPELLVHTLRYAYQHTDLYRHLHPALPIAGQDGTLRSRMRGSAACGNVHAKTGTVEGVSSLAGYATAPNGHLLCFAIMNQGVRYTSTGRRFQDNVCDALTRRANAPAAEEEEITDDEEEQADEQADTPRGNDDIPPQQTEEAATQSSDVPARLK